MKTRLLQFFIVIAVIFCVKNADATTFIWVGGSGNWNVQSNWYNNSSNSTNNGYPGKSSTGDIVVFQISYPNSYPYTNTPTIVNTLPYSIAQIQTQAYAATTITLNSSVILNVTGGLAITGTYGGTYDGLTFAGSGSASIGGATTLTYYATLTIGSSNTVAFPAGSSITAGNSNCTVTNNGILNFNGTSASPIVVNFADYGTFTNTGTASATYTTIGSSNNNPTITNSNSLTLTSSTIKLNGQYGTLTNTGTLNATSTTFTLSANYVYIYNTKNFTATSCPINVTGYNAYITNTSSTANFIANNCPIVLSTNNGCNITNASLATFTAQAGSSILISSYQGYISNGGTFYAGTSNSACTITITSQYGNISNTSSGTFSVGTTSGITMSGIQENVTNSSGGSFTFESDQYGTGYAGKIPVTSPSSSTPVFTGSFKVERYVTANRAYRLFSSPVYQGTVSGNKVSNLDFILASTLVTGTTTSSGFDKVANPSVYLYREDQAVSNATFTSGNFWGVSKINNSPTYNLYMNAGSTNYNIPVGNGIFAFFRGDRTSNLVNKYTAGTAAEAVTMTIYGTLNQGQIQVKNWYTPGASTLGYTTTTGNSTVRGYNLVGNPYASAIDWDTFNTSATVHTTGINGPGVNGTYYILDPVSKNYGSYPVGQGFPGTHGATNIIPSGVGFFVIASSGSTLYFNENAKTTGQATGTALLMGKPADVANVQYLRLQLAKDSVNVDDMIVRFNSSASPDYVANEDAPYKQGSGAVSLCSVSSNDIYLAINNLPLPKKSESIALNINTSADGIYKLDLTQLVGIPQLYDIWLMDDYKKDSLDLKHNPTYSFNVYKNDSTSFGSKRFSLYIRQNPAYAYHLVDFTAKKAPAATQVQVVWQAANEANYTHFTVMRSTDGGKNFEVIGGQASSSQSTYSLLDKTPVTGQNLYQLKQEDLNGAITWSKIATVMFSDKATTLAEGKLNVYPNPASSVINLAIAPDANAGSYNISITNSSGQLIKEVTSAQNAWQSNVNNLMPGTYLIQVVNNKDKSLIGKTKFVKL